MHKFASCSPQSVPSALVNCPPPNPVDSIDAPESDVQSPSGGDAGRVSRVAGRVLRYMSGDPSPQYRKFRLAIATGFAALFAGFGMACTTSLIASTYWAVAIGTLWAMAMANIDTTTTALVEERAGWGRLKALLPRASIVIIAGYVLGEVTALKYFESEISAQLSEQHYEHVRKKRDAAEARYQDALTKTSAAYSSQSKEYEGSLARLEEQIEKREVDTRKAGEAIVTATQNQRLLHDADGRAYLDSRSVRTVEAEALRASRDSKAFEETLKPDLEHARTGLKEIGDARQATEQRLASVRDQDLKEVEAFQAPQGLLARLDALSTICKQSSTARYACWLAAILMMAFESLPIWLKLAQRFPKAEVREKFGEALTRVLNTRRWQDHAALMTEASSYTWNKAFLSELGRDIGAGNETPKHKPVHVASPSVENVRDADADRRVLRLVKNRRTGANNV